MDCRDYIGSSKEAIALRAEFSKADKEAGFEKFVEQQLSVIDKALHQVVIEASIEANHYWKVVKSLRNDYKGWDSLCRIGTRVTFKGGSFSAEWYRNRYVANKDKPEGSRKDVFSTYLRKGRGFHYPMHHFSREPEWVREQVAYTEKRYSLLRERAAHLTSMRRSVAAYKRLYEQGKTLGKE